MKSCRYRRMTVRPRPCLLELCGQAEKGRLIAEAPNKVGAHWKIVCIPEEWHRHCGLAGGVAYWRKRHELMSTFHPL
jgi:hypothetical protein